MDDEEGCADALLTIITIFVIVGIIGLFIWVIATSNII